MGKVSFLDCPHKNVQQFTETCMDCGYNIYMTEEEYLAELKKEVRQRDHEKKEGKVREEIRQLEQRLK